MAAKPIAAAAAVSEPPAATQGVRSAKTAADTLRRPPLAEISSRDSEPTHSPPHRESGLDSCAGGASRDRLPSPPEVQFAGGRLSAVPEELASEDGRSSSSSVHSGTAAPNRSIAIDSALAVTVAAAANTSSLPHAGGDRRQTTPPPAVPRYPPPSLRLPSNEPSELDQCKPSVITQRQTDRQGQLQRVQLQPDHQRQMIADYGEDSVASVAPCIARESTSPLLSRDQRQLLDGAGDRSTAGCEMHQHSRPARTSFRVMIEKHSDEAPLQATVAVQQAPVSKVAHAGISPSPSQCLPGAGLTSNCDSTSDSGDVSIETVPEKIVNVTANTVLSTSSSTTYCESPAEAQPKKVAQKPGTVLQGIAYGLGNDVEARDVQVKRFSGGRRRMALQDMAAHRGERRPKMQVTVSTTTIPPRGDDTAATLDAASTTPQNVVNGLKVPTSIDATNQAGTAGLHLPIPASQITVRHEISAGSGPLLGALMERLIAAGGPTVVDASSANPAGGATAAGAASRDDARLVVLERKLQMAEKQVGSLQAQLQDRHSGVQGELLTLIVANQHAVQTQLQALAAQATLQHSQPPAARAAEVVVAQQPSLPTARPVSPPERLLRDPPGDSSRTPAPRIKLPVPSARPDGLIGGSLSSSSSMPVAMTHHRARSCEGSTVNDAPKGNGEGAATGLLAELLAMDATSPQRKADEPPSPSLRCNEHLVTEVVQLKEMVDSLLAEQKLSRRLEHRKALIDPAPVDRLMRAGNIISHEKPVKPRSASRVAVPLEPRSAARGAAVDNLDATFLADGEAVAAAPKLDTVGSFVACALEDLARLKAKESSIDESLAAVERMCRRAELDERLRALADFSLATVPAGGLGDSDVSRAVSAAPVAAVATARIDSLTDKSRVKLVVNQHLAAASVEVQEKLAALAAREASIVRQQRGTTKRVPTVATNVAFGRTMRIPGAGKDSLKVVSAKVDSGLHLQHEQKNVAAGQPVDKENYPCRTDPIVDSYKDEHYIKRVYGRTLYDNQRRTTQRCGASPKSPLHRPRPYKNVTAKRMRSAKVQVQESPPSLERVASCDTSVNEYEQPSTLSKAVAIIPPAPVYSPVTIILGPGMTTADHAPYAAFTPTLLPSNDALPKAAPSQIRPPSLAAVSAATAIATQARQSIARPAVVPRERAKSTSEGVQSLSFSTAEAPVCTSDQSLACPATSRLGETPKIANKEIARRDTADGKRADPAVTKDDQTPESDADSADNFERSANRNNNADSRREQRHEKEGEASGDNSDAGSAQLLAAERSSGQQSDDEVSPHGKGSTSSETASGRLNENASEGRLRAVSSRGIDNDGTAASQTPLQTHAAREEDRLIGMRSWQSYVEPQFRYEESVVEEQYSGEDEIPDPPVCVDGHTRPSPANYAGPAFPPLATARPLGAPQSLTARSVSAATTAPRDPVANIDLGWVERQLMARIVQRMLSVPEVGASSWDAAAAAPKASKPFLRAATFPSPTAVTLQESPFDYQVYVDADDEHVDDASLESLIRECLLERLRTMLGTRREVLLSDSLGTDAERDTEPTSGRRKATSSELASAAVLPVHVGTPHATPPRAMSPVSPDSRQVVTPDITPARSDESISSAESVVSQLIAANPELAAAATAAIDRGASPVRQKATGDNREAFNLSQVSLWDTMTLGLNRTAQPGLESSGIEEPAVDRGAAGIVSGQRHDIVTPSCTPPPSPPSAHSSVHEAAHGSAARVRTPTPTSPSEDDEDPPEAASQADPPLAASAEVPVEKFVSAPSSSELIGSIPSGTNDGLAPALLSPEIRTVPAASAAVSHVRAAADRDSFEASASDEASHCEPGHTSAATVTETMNEPLSEGEWLLKSEGQVASKKVSGDTAGQQSDSNSTLSSDEDTYGSMAPVAAAGDLSDGELRTMPQCAPPKQQLQRSPLLSLLAKVQEPVVRLQQHTSTAEEGRDGGGTQPLSTELLPGSSSVQQASALSSTRSGRRSPGEVYPSRALATSAEVACEPEGGAVVDEAAVLLPATSSIKAAKNRASNDAQPSTSDDDGGDGDANDAFVRSHAITVRPRPQSDEVGSYWKSDETPTRGSLSGRGLSRNRPMFGTVHSTVERGAAPRSTDGPASSVHGPTLLSRSSAAPAVSLDLSPPHGVQSALVATGPVMVPKPLPTGVFSRSAAIAVPSPGDAGMVTALATGDGSIDTTSMSLPQNASVDESQVLGSTHSTDRIDIDSLVRSGAYAGSQTLSGTWEPSAVATALVDVGVLPSGRNTALSAGVRYDEPDLYGSNTSLYEHRSAPSYSSSADEMSDHQSTSFG